MNEFSSKGSINEEEKNGFDYISFDIDKKIDSEMYSNKLKKDQTKLSMNDKEIECFYKIDTKKINNNFKKGKKENHYIFNKHFNIISSNLNKIQENNLLNNYSIKNGEMPLVLKNENKIENRINALITKDNNINNKIIYLKSNSIKKLEINSPVKNKEITEFETSKIKRTDFNNYLSKSKNSYRDSDSSRIENNDFIQPKNFFENFEKVLTNQKDKIYKFNTGHLFSNYNKEDIFDKIQRKHLKNDEKERKKELSRKKINFVPSESNIKHSSSLDLSIIKNQNSFTSRLKLDQTNSNINSDDLSK